MVMIHCVQERVVKYSFVFLVLSSNIPFLQGLKSVSVPFGGARSSGSGMNLVLGRVTLIAKAFPVTFAAVVRFGLVWDRRNLTGKWC
jgi:hypothetical protein